MDILSVISTLLTGIFTAAVKNIPALLRLKSTLELLAQSSLFLAATGAPFGLISFVKRAIKFFL